MENKETKQDIFIRTEEGCVKSVQNVADSNFSVQNVADSNFNAVILQGQSAMKLVLLINAEAVLSVMVFCSGHIEVLLSADSRIIELYI